MRIVTLILALWVASPAAGATIVLDFEEEPLGFRDWGYLSLECGCVSFAHGSRPDEDEPASVYSWGYPTGKAFSLLSDQTMPLTLSFLSVVESVSLDFQAGRTDNSNRPEPWDGVITPGAQAVLTVFLGATELGEARVLLDLVSGGMDQSIGISGVGAFDRAVLRYSGAELSPTIDNVIFSTVPEPGTSLLLIGLLAGVAARTSCRRQVVVRAFAALLLLLAAPGSAATIVLDFEEEALADYENNDFASAECGCVRFSDLGGEQELHVVDYGGTRALLAGWQGGTLLLEFLVPVVGLSLDFVSFYPSSEQIDYYDAHLTAYAGGEIVGAVDLTPDPDGPLFQTISLLPGTVVERARFVRAALGEYQPLSPIVDNIVLTTVPEPGALGLFALALAGAAARSRVRRGSSRQVA